MIDIATRLRQTRADMIGTDDEQHYWDCHNAADEIERLRQFDRPQPIKTAEDTPDTQATPPQGSVHGEGTVGERLVERVLITQSLLDDNETLRAEIARLREAIRRLAGQDATLSVQGGNVTVTLDATLTEAEHDALEFAVETGRVAIHDEATLRNLLERLHT